MDAWVVGWVAKRAGLKEKAVTDTLTAEAESVVAARAHYTPTASLFIVGCALMRRGFVRELRAVSGESLTRVRLIGPYHRLLVVCDA